MGYSPLTLRFNSPQMEVGFILRKKDALVGRLKAVAGIAAVAAALIGVLETLTGASTSMRELFRRDSSPTEMAYRAVQIKLAGYIFFIGLDTLLFIALSIQAFVRNVPPALLELIGTITMILNMLAVLTLPSYALKILGSSFKDAYGEDKYTSDTHLLLFLNAMTTAAHVGVPLRWCSLFHIEIAGILMYTMVVFVIGSNETLTFSYQSLSLLTCIVVISALGKRGIEAGERQAFMEIIKEKSLRCQAEYELQANKTKREEAVEAADAQSQRRSNPDSQRRSMPGSVATTTPSNKIFDPRYHDEEAGVPKQLADIADLGNGEHWHISAADVKLQHDDVLGVGGFGKVVKGFFAGVAVAVKVPHDKRQVSDLHALPELCNELRVLRYLRHPNIVALHGAVISPRESLLAIVLELVHGTLLKDVVDNGGGGRLDVPTRCRLMLGVCNALLYLHSRRPQVVHGDLKSRNVMVVLSGDKLTPKLLDFGLSRVITRRAKHLGGTLRWMAPELCQVDAPVKCSSDVYSFGRLIVYIANGSEPMPNMRTTRVRRLLGQMRPPRATWPGGCAFEPSCKALVQECIRAEEGERPHIAEVHWRLAAVPRELGVVETHRHVFEDLELASEDVGNSAVAMQVPDDAPAQDADAPAHQASADGAPQEPPQDEKLCPLPEDEPLGAAAQEVPSQPTGSFGAPLAGSRGSAPPSSPPELMETSLGAMELTLVRAVARWRFDRPTEFTCCKRHAALDLARMVCNLALSWPCVEQPPFCYSTQCPQCGILGVHNGVCDICEGSQSGEEVGQGSS